MPTLLRITLLALLLPACQSTLQDGRFTCSTTADCPAGFGCRTTEHLCYRDIPDAGAPVDTSIDARALDMGALPDGSPTQDTNVGTVAVLVLNADPDLAASVGLTLATSADMLTMNVPIYGTTVGPFDLPAGASLDVTLGSAAPKTFPGNGSGRQLVVIGPLGASGSHELRVLASPTSVGTASDMTVQFIDMAVDDGTGLSVIAADTAPVDLTHGMAPVPVTYPAPRGSAIERATVLDTHSSTTIFSVGADKLAPFDSYIGVIAGRVQRPLGAPDGLRLIPAIPSASGAPIASQPIYRFANTLISDVVVCEGATVRTSVAAGAIAGPLFGLEGRDFTATVGTTCGGGMPPLTLDALNGERTLVTIAGDVINGWSMRELPEPLLTGYAFTIQNGQAQNIDVTADGTGASAIAQYAHHDFPPISSPIGRVVVTQGPLAPATFTWSAMSAWSVGVYESQSGPLLYQLEAPYVGSWVLVQHRAL